MQAGRHNSSLDAAAGQSPDFEGWLKRNNLDDFSHFARPCQDLESDGQCNSIVSNDGYINCKTKCNGR